MGRGFTFFHNTNRKAVSGKIRGVQIGNYLGAKLNPESGYEDDVCIYVKRLPPKYIPKCAYIDIIDSMFLVNWTSNHPEIGVIAISEVGQEYLSQKLKRKDVYLIPEHHCNFEREIRPDRKVTTVGYMGTQNGSIFTDGEIDSRRKVIADIKKQFKQIGLNFKFITRYRRREDVVNFYKSIDIQVTYRRRKQIRVAKLKNPLKLANAGSFGIPTVAYPEITSREFKDGFIEVNSIGEMITQCERLKNDKTLYEDISGKALEKSENYHISKIASLYNNLGSI
jgi:hypothetical protein